MLYKLTPTFLTKENIEMLCSCLMVIMNSRKNSPTGKTKRGARARFFSSPFRNKTEESKKSKIKNKKIVRSRWRGGKFPSRTHTRQRGILGISAFYLGPLIFPHTPVLSAFLPVRLNKTPSFWHRRLKHHVRRKVTTSGVKRNCVVDAVQSWLAIRNRFVWLGKNCGFKVWNELWAESL